MLSVKPEHLGRNDELGSKARNAARMNSKKAGKTFQRKMQSDPASGYDQLEDMMKMFEKLPPTLLTLRQINQVCSRYMRSF
eukprot:UN24732